MQRAEQERIASVTWAEGGAEAATIITAAMERTSNAIVEVRPIYMAKEIAAKVGRATRTTAYNVGRGRVWRSGSEGEGTGSTGRVSR